MPCRDSGAEGLAGLEMAPGGGYVYEMDKAY